MSYILDALKKSQVAREQGDSGKATDVYVQALGTLRRSRTLLWVGLGLLVLNFAAFAAWFAYTRQSTTPEPALARAQPAPLPALPPAPLSPLVSAPSAINQPERIPEPQPLAEAAVNDPMPAHLALTDPGLRNDRGQHAETARTRDRLPVQAISDKSAKVHQDNAQLIQESDKAASAPAGSAWENTKMLWYAELDESMRQRFPNLKLDVHVYAEPANERFVFIEMTKFREGDTTPSGLHVDKIESDGVILSHAGTHFRLPAQ